MERTPLKPGKFAEDLTAVLEIVYCSGMNGWGGDKAAIYQEALRTTPLDPSQLKVYNSYYGPLITPDS